MTQRIELGQIIDAAPARVVVTRDLAGSPTQAAFDLSGLPRVDSFLVGRPVLEVPKLVERLCGICPVAHHLAGMRALEALAGIDALPPTAVAVRRLLHHAGVIDIHAVGMFSTFRDEALALRRFAKAVMTAAGSPGHFPTTAVPGGVVAPADVTQLDTCHVLLTDAFSAASRIAEQSLALSAPVDRFCGVDLALTGADGRLDLFGNALRAVAADGNPVIAAATAYEWDSLIVETVPGSATPKPYLVALGADAGAYRVGPVAQLRTGQVMTPIAASLQREWRASGAGAAAARAIITVHAIEVIEDLLDSPDLIAGESSVGFPQVLPQQVGVGWVDSARGLLVHRYESDEQGRVRAATILTPTAQNEPWLGELLLQAAGAENNSEVRAGMEEAIREADPCLPCSSAPAGTMDLVVDSVVG
ncbi:MAG: nickel-dependent hydrogenase large subunit [Propionibacteriaceae bacterium]|nr:nickel-dependent hydrogenase large subunit [Propionibacteriaceae bacterium]